MYLYDYGKLDEERTDELSYEREHYGKTLTEDEVINVVGATIKAETTESAQQRKATLKTIRTMLDALGYDERWISNEVRPYAEDVYAQFRSPDEPLLPTVERRTPDELHARSSALDERESALKAREYALYERESMLDHYAAELDKRAQDL